MKKLLFILVLAVFSNSSIAADKDYKMCSIAGYFLGADELFLKGVAGQILVDQNISIISDPICNAAWKNGMEIAKYMNESPQLKNKADETVFRQAYAFQRKVYKTIISVMEK